MPSYPTKRRDPLICPQTAIAASINLRCFAHLSRRPDHKLSLDLPDIGLVREWDIDVLPWGSFTAQPTDKEGKAPAELDPASFAAVEKFLTDDGLGSTAHAAALAIIYVYMTIGNKQERLVRLRETHSIDADSSLMTLCADEEPATALDPHCPLEQVLGPQLPMPRASRRLSCDFSTGSRFSLRPMDPRLMRRTPVIVGFLHHKRT